jgi:ABC-type oligopeptide transport system substrate-binding subunit
LGTREIQFTLTKPYAFFLKQLSYPTNDALDQKVVAGKTRNAANNFLTNNCPGNQGPGPMKFKCFGSAFYPSGQTPSYTMVPNPYYYGKKARVQVVLPAIDSWDTGYRVYQADGIDTVQVPAAFQSKWKGNKQFHVSAQTLVVYAATNQHIAPFDNVHCRLAAAYAIDRKTITDKVLHGADKPIYDIVPPGFLGYYNGADNPHYSVAKAKAELAQCPGKNTQVTYTYDTTGSDSDNRAAALVQMMNAVGFNAKVKAISANDWFSIVSSGYGGMSKSQTQMVFNDWTQDYPDPQDYVELLMDCNQDYNIGGWCNQQFHSLMLKADVEQNAKKRAQEYIQAQHLAISQGAWITQYNSLLFQLIKPWVHGLVTVEGYAVVVPKDMDWANVTISKH